MGGVGKAAGKIAGSAASFGGGGLGNIAGGFGAGILGGLGSALGKGSNQKYIDMLNDESGKPQSVYSGFLDDSGMLANQYQLNTALDKQALGALQAKALNEGPSKWAQLAGEKAASDAALNKSLAASQSQGAIADAASSLARKGGLSSGASERLAAAGAGNVLGAQQNIGAQLASQGQDIALQDELQKQQALALLPGLQQQASQFELQKEQYNKGKPIELKENDYEQQMKAYAAKKAGLATLAGGKKG